MPGNEEIGNRIATARRAVGWSQVDLAERAGIPRTSVSAIEGSRLTPSVTAALKLASALECSVEDLFGGRDFPRQEGSEVWAWEPRMETSRYWKAEVQGRSFLYPVESSALNPVPHDGVWQGGVDKDSCPAELPPTLVVACCDPAAGLLASEYARVSGFRMIVVQRGGLAALELLKRGLVHVAGIHRSTAEAPNRNAETLAQHLGKGHRLLRVAEWQEGLALPNTAKSRSIRSATRDCSRWALREPGSAARECLEELMGSRTLEGRCVQGHSAVAEAIRGGWADAGICVRIAAEEAQLHFLPVRTESLDLCFSKSQSRDPRVLALIKLLGSRPYRRLLSELPGYDATHSGELA